MTPVGKIETIVELYRCGYLCKCDKHDEIWDDNEYCYRREIRHESTCDARVKAMLMLQEEKDLNG